jgi:hypothetical protein
MGFPQERLRRMVALPLLCNSIMIVRWEKEMDEFCIDDFSSCRLHKICGKNVVKIGDSEQNHQPLYFAQWQG